MKLNKRASIYLILTLIGIAFAFYSIKIKNYFLFVTAVLFAIVSADNIFCSLK